MPNELVLFPLIGYPSCRFGIPPIPVASSCNRVRRVHDAMKNENAGACWDGRRLKVVQRELGNAVVFPTGTPVARPVAQLALFV